MLYHSGARNYTCDLCGNKFFQMEHLKRHMQSIHSITTPNNTNQTQTAKQLTTKPKSKTSKSSKLVEKLQSQQEQTIIQSDSTPLSQENEIKTSERIVNSICMYKCQQCDYSTKKLFSLNEHLIEKHSSTSHSNINQLISQEIHFDTSNANSQHDNGDDESDSDELSIVDDILNELTSIRVYSCSFCIFSTEKKRNLKVSYN